MDEMMIRVDDLHRSGEEAVLLSAVSFSVPKKGVHGILGPKRSGKTELLEILAGIHMEFTGTVTVAGQPLSGGDASWKKKISYLPEELALDSELSAEEVMDLYGKARGVASEKRARQITEALELVGLSDLRRRLVRRLTKGQQKKLALAAALIGNPSLLLLDEPIQGLSVEEREEMVALIQMLGTMKTVVLATERYDTAESLCEDIVLLSDGTVLAEGTFQALEEKLQGKGTTLRELYRSLCGAGKEESK